MRSRSKPAMKKAAAKPMAKGAKGPAPKKAGAAKSASKAPRKG